MKDMSYLKRLSMSASVSSSITPPPPSSSLRAVSSTDLRILPSPSPARRARRRTGPAQERVSALTPRNVHVAPLALVEGDREFLLPDQRGKPPRGGDVPGGQRGERGGVEVRRLPHGGQERPVLVDQEDHLRIGIGQKLLQDRLECVVFLLVEDEMTPVHSREDTTAIRQGKEFGFPQPTAPLQPGAPFRWFRKAHQAEGAGGSEAGRPERSRAGSPHGGPREGPP